jgi:hypothetical protein
MAKPCGVSVTQATLLSKYSRLHFMAISTSLADFIFRRGPRHFGPAARSLPLADAGKPGPASICSLAAGVCPARVVMTSRSPRRKKARGGAPGAGHIPHRRSRRVVILRETREDRKVCRAAAASPSALALGAPAVRDQIHAAFRGDLADAASGLDDLRPEQLAIQVAAQLGSARRDPNARFSGAAALAKHPNRGLWYLARVGAGRHAVAHRRIHHASSRSAPSNAAPAAISSRRGPLCVSPELGRSVPSAIYHSFGRRTGEFTPRAGGICPAIARKRIGAHAE